MSPKRPARRKDAPKTAAGPARVPPAGTDSDIAEFPLTLRNLRLGIAGRLGRPFTQAEAAKKAKINQASLSNVERGNQNASAFLLFRLAEVYGCPLLTVHAAYAGSQRRLDDEFKSRKAKR